MKMLVRAGPGVSAEFALPDSEDDVLDSLKSAKGVEVPQQKTLAAEVLNVLLATELRSQTRQRAIDIAADSLGRHLDHGRRNVSRDGVSHFRP